MTCPANMVLRSVKWPWMLATPDFFVLNPESHEDELLMIPDSFLECKTTAWYLGRHWKAGALPPYVEAQVNHYLAVTGFSHAWAAVLIGGQSFVHIRVERDEAVLTALAETERRFWEYVQAGEMPPDPFTLEPGRRPRAVRQQRSAVGGRAAPRHAGHDPGLLRVR
jgi:predicted phage-related endonuclease